MKRYLFIIVIITIGLAAMTTSVQAQNKRAEKKAQQTKAYNKALKAIESGYFILIPDATGRNTAMDRRTSFVLIKGDKGAIQDGPPATSTGLRPISGKEIKIKPNGDVLFRCKLKPYNNAEGIIYITLRHGGDIARTTVYLINSTNMMGRIIPESEADYILYKNLEDNEDTP